MSVDTRTSRVTRSSVLGKRAHQQQDASAATPTKLCDVQLPTPDSTPSPKRARTSVGCHDGDSNKENIPPLSNEIIGSDASPTSVRTARSIRRTATEQLTPSRPRQMRKHASMASMTPTTPTHEVSPISLVTPPATPRTLLPLHVRAKALLRSTSNDTKATITCRDTEHNAITGFLQSFLSGEATQRCLYISGSPGTGKTALLNSVLRTLDHDQCNVVSINCMTLKGVDALWQKLFDDLISADAELNKAMRPKKLKGYEAVEAALAALSGKCVLVLDELDHVASDSRALNNILSLPAINSESFCLIGIANTHTLTSCINTGKDVLTTHFAPYTAAQLQQILQSRLSVLNDDNPTDAGTKALFPLPALTLLTKKIATMTGDVRNLFEALRRAIDIATSSPNLNENPLNHTPTVTPASILQALKSHTPATNGTSSKFSATSSEPAACNSEIVSKINGINLQARVILLSILLASKRLGAGLPLSSGSSAPRKATSLKRSHSASSPRQACIETAQLHSYYSATLVRCDAACLNVASKSEFSDLLVILEGAGLISSGSHLSSTTSVRQGKKAAGRSASFSGLRKSLAMSQVQLADGVWTNEVLRGLGIADATGDDVLQSELRGIWERETSRLEREIKSLSQCEPSSSD